MFLTKYPHPANFSFATSYQPKTGRLALKDVEARLHLTAYEGHVYHLRVEHERWGESKCLLPLDPPAPTTEQALLALTSKGGLSLKGAGGDLLEGQPEATFGVCGEASLFQIQVPEGTRFYGMGEKTFNKLELSGIRSKFWNTDVWGDFHFAQWMEHPSDPSYLSVPYLIAKIGEEYVGFLLHNPSPTFFETPGRPDAEDIFVEWQRTSKNLLLGSESGEPNLWVIYGPSLAELTRKLQKLVGATPTPPLWALGYHQSKWGYGGEEDLLRLDSSFEEHEIPCDGLWLDIDYMDGYRVFTYGEDNFPNGIPSLAEKLAAKGRKIVPIIDPGVKREAGYAIFDEGVSSGAFCQNPNGDPFMGLVWPGETVFPDFTLETVREWWAGLSESFLQQGFGGAWIDMNDPSTGPVDPHGMLFRNGQDPHAAHRNQYALGMQMATHDGFLRARPDERPFLLSRSGFIGTSRYSACWTGDNLSNYFYLSTCVPTTLNLALSGIPFNGPDVGGFGGDTTEDLMVKWVKACFLFPFMRNHSVKDQRNQEPWAFDERTLNVLQSYITLRYELRPYLYNLFAEHEETGEAIIRPLLYDFPSTEDMPLEDVADQFMVGPFVLQAPVLTRDRTRTIMLPGSRPWFDLSGATWTQPDIYEVAPRVAETPIFIRDGAVIPFSLDFNDLRKVDLHVFIAPSTKGETRYVYRADDGISYGYRRGERSELEVTLEWDARRLDVRLNRLSEGYGPIEASLTLHDLNREVTVDGRPVEENPVDVYFIKKVTRARELR
jgi:alpha-glucosidase